MKKQISSKIVSIVFSILVICFAVSFYIFAWTEPTTAPPGGNVFPPLNTGGDAQIKTGALRVGGLTVDYDSYLATLGGSVGIGTASPGAKLHVGGTPGTDGIMFPDGTLQTTAAGTGSGGFSPDPYTGQESITFPNGLILKMGTVTVGADSIVSVTYAEAFPTNVIQVQLTLMTDYNYYLEWGDFWTKTSLQTKSGFAAGNGYDHSETFNWQAWGY